MVSHVFYRWGASNSEKRVDFDGTHISVFDLKREMILQAHMGNGKDEDVKVFDNVTGEGTTCLWLLAIPRTDQDQNSRTTIIKYHDHQMS